MIGQFVQVKIDKVTPFTLEGTVEDECACPQKSK